MGYEGPYDESTVDYRLDGAPREPPGDESSNPHAQIGNNPDLVVRLLHGNAEDTQWYDVPMSTSASFADALQEAGYDVDVPVVEGANHTAIHNGTDVQQAIVDHVSDVLHDG